MEELDLFQYYIDTVYCFCYDDDEISPEIYFMSQIEDSTKEVQDKFVDYMEKQTFQREEDIVEFIRNKQKDIALVIGL